MENTNKIGQPQPTTPLKKVCLSLSMDSTCLEFSKVDHQYNSGK